MIDATNEVFIVILGSESTFKTSLTQIAIDWLKLIIERNGFTWIDVSTWKYEGGHSFSGFEYKYLSLEQSLGRIAEAELPLFKERCEKLFGEHVADYNSHLTTHASHDQNYVRAFHAVESALNSLFVDVGRFSGEYVDRFAINAAENLTSVLKERRIPLKLIVPLVNIISDDMGIRIPFEDMTGDTVIFRVLRDEEMRAVYTSDYDWRQHDASRPEIPQTWPYAIVCDYFEEIVPASEKKVVCAADLIMKKVERAITAIMLEIKNPTGYLGAFSVPKKCLPMTTRTRFYSKATVPGAVHKITSEATRPILRWYKNLENIRSSSLDLALSRYSDAMRRLKPSDQILDAVSGIESILLHSKDGSQKTEIAHRFALNFASLFEGADEKLKKFKLGKQLYAARSKVAHGSDLSKLSLGDEKNVPPKTVAKECTDRLNEIIRRSIDCKFEGEDYFLKLLFGIPT